MRPETAKRKISCTFIYKLSPSDMTMMSIHDIIYHLKSIQPELEKMHRLSKVESGDNRPGYQTYGYDDLESIKYNIGYISDRWNTRFRIRWLLDLIELVESKEDLYKIIPLKKFQEELL